MAQACEASRLLLHAPAAAAETTSTKGVAPATATSACAHDDITAAPAWQAKSARDWRVIGGSHLTRKEDSRAHASASRLSTPQENYSPSAARDSHSPFSNSENSASAPADQAKSIAKPGAITCFNCGTSGHAASACNSDARSARKCYACGSIGHIARVCPTRAVQKAAYASSFTLGGVASTCRSAGQLCSEAVIGDVRDADELVDTSSALSMLSNAMYAQLLDTPVIQPFSRAAPKVVGVGGASAAIRGYLDAPV